MIMKFWWIINYGIKRVFDIIVSLCLLILLSPLMLIVALLVRRDGGEAIFKQVRMGYKGKAYTMYKFRSMVVNAQQKGSGVYSFSGDSRITPIGKILRKTSIDELPQLFNIIKGDMSFVGPRSPVYDAFPKYEHLTPDFKKRFSVLPGITGWAQVVGRNDLNWNEKVQQDNIYVDRFSKFGVVFDWIVLVGTIVRVFSMKDVEENPENEKINKEIFSKMRGDSVE